MFADGNLFPLPFRMFFDTVGRSGINHRRAEPTLHKQFAIGFHVAVFRITHVPAEYSNVFLVAPRLLVVDKQKVTNFVEFQ